MSRNTEVFSAWGNSVQGIFITWGNTAADSSGTISGTTEMLIDVDLRLYGLGSNLQAADTAARAGTLVSSDFINAYYLIQNPYDKSDYDAAAAAAIPSTVYYNGWANGAFDGALLTFTATVSAGSDYTNLDDD